MAGKKFEAQKTIFFNTYDSAKCNQEEKNGSKHSQLNIKVQVKS